MLTSGAHGFDEVMNAERLDALLFPIGSGAILSARPGYPTVIVPFAMVANEPSAPFPQGFNARPMPFGVSFAGGACAEPRLIALTHQSKLINLTAPFVFHTLVATKQYPQHVD